MDNQIRKYKIFTASPIWISIVHLISILFFQANFNITASNEILGYGSYGFLFGISQFAFSLSTKSGLNGVKLSVSLTSIVIGLALMFLSYFSLNKNKKFIIGSLIVYSIDFIFSIIGMIVCSISSEIRLNFVSYFFSIFIHIIGIGLIVYSLLISLKIKE